MSTALAVKGNGEIQTHMGQKDQIAAIRDRIVSMMPGAAGAPQDVQWAAAQLAVMHKLNPFNGEIYVMQIGSKKEGNAWVPDWRAHVGVKGLRKLARNQANFMTDARVMDASEVKAQRRENYDNDDIGVEVTLWRLDVAMQCKQIGIDYKPVKAMGFWRVKAQYHNQKKEWMPDSIPNTWSAQMVAEKRAEINAIKQAFDMVIDVADPSQEHFTDELHQQVQVLDRDEAPMLDGPKADDDMLFATPRGRHEPVEEDEYTDFDESPEDEPQSEALAMLLKALEMVKGTGPKAQKHIGETLKRKGAERIEDLSDADLDTWRSFLEQAADKQAA